MNSPQPPMPPPHQYAPPPFGPVKRKSRAPLILGVMAIAFVVFVGGCVALVAAVGKSADKAAKDIESTLSNLPNPATPAAGAKVITYTYEVVGSATAANVTYIKDESLSQEQVGEAALPWRKEVQFRDGLFLPLSLVAQSNSERNVEITCRILKDGKVVKEATSSGPFAVATCAGS